MSNSTERKRGRCQQMCIRGSIGKMSAVLVLLCLFLIMTIGAEELRYRFRPNTSHNPGRHLSYSIEGPGRSGDEGPIRVRISPFDLELEPTPIQLLRADEDLILAELQDLLMAYMRSKASSSGGEDLTFTLEYVLFSDIESNSWSMGVPILDEAPKTTLRFNGGVVSFLGTQIPSRDEVNEWVEQAVNGAFASSLHDTPYNYVEKARYVTEDSATHAPAAQKTVEVVDLDSSHNVPNHVGALLGFFAVVVAMIVVLIGLYAQRNRSERSQVVPDKKDGVAAAEEEDEEVIDFTFSLEKDLEELRNQLSIASEPSQDEASVHSSASASEFTLSSSSANMMIGLSYLQKNPQFSQQESFQKERKIHVSKDMLYSSWAGSPPQIDAQFTSRNGSVLKPSSFSATAERERESDTNQHRNHSQTNEDDPDLEDGGAVFEQAHEKTSGSKPLYLVPPTRVSGRPPRTPRPKRTKDPEQKSSRGGAGSRAIV